MVGTVYDLSHAWFVINKNTKYVPDFAFTNYEDAKEHREHLKHKDWIVVDYFQLDKLLFT
jgi:hypothetical protein